MTDSPAPRRTGSARIHTPAGLVPSSPLPSGVCMLSGELPPERGGVGDYTARLADALAAQGVRIGLLTARRPGLPSRRSLGEYNVPVYGTVPGWDARLWPLVRRALTRLGPRPLLHIQFQAGAYALGGSVHLAPGLIRATLPSARVVTTFHDFLPPYLFPKAGPARLAANRLLARSSHAAVFAELSDLDAAGSGVRGTVLPIGSNIDCQPDADLPRDEVRRRLGADDATFLIGYFGFLNPSKGVPTLLEAVGRLVAAAPDRPVRLALLGAEFGISNPTDLAQARAVHDAVERANLTDRVAKTGYLTPPELSSHLLACDAIALPFLDGASARRGTLMAALAHGRPIISTLPRPRAVLAGPAAVWLGSGPGAAVIRDGEAALLTRPGDAAALATALARLRDDPPLRDRLAAGALAVGEQISWSAIARATTRIYASTFGAQDCSPA